MGNTRQRDEAHNRRTPSARIAVRSSQARAALVVGAFAAYALAYLPLRAQAGIAAGLLSMVPVSLAGWAFGLRGGLLAGLIVTPLHTILVNLAGYPGWDVILRETDGLGPLAAVAAGVAAGYWSDLIRALRQQVAERKRAEQALRENQGRLAGVIGFARDAIISLDAEQRIILFNPAAEQMFGCPAAEVVGQPLDRFIPEFLREAHREHVRAFGQTNQTRRSMAALGPLICLRADGEEFPAEISISQVEMAGHKIYTAILRDVTERVRAEVALRLQSAALESAANGIVITDREGIIQWTNPAFTRLTGYTAAEAVGKNPRDLVRSGKQDRAFYKRMWDTILAGQVWRGELINRRKDGTLYTEEMTLTPLQDERGEVIRFIAIKQDITERKQVEQALSESERKYHALFEQSHDAIFILDFQGRHLDANQRAANMLGYTPAELIGLSFRDISAEIAQSEHILKRLLRGDHIPLFERIFRKKDGGLIPVEINVELVRDIHRNPLHIQSVVRDITERKQAEKTLRDSQTRYRMLFEDSPVVLLEEDFSAVKQYLDRLRDSVQNWTSYFEDHPDVVRQCAALVRIVDVNQAALAWYHADSKESPLVNLNQIFDQSSYPSFVDELLALAQGKTSYESARTRASAPRDSLHLIVRGTVAPGYEDSWGRVLVSILDVTERVQALEALRASNETLRALIQVSPLAVILFDPTGNVKLWNPAAERIFGWTEQEAIGRFNPIVPEGKYAEFQAWLTSTLQGQVMLAQEARCQRKDGVVVDVSLSTAGLYDADGNLGDVVAIMADITERKRADKLQSALYRISEAALAAQDLDELYPLIHGIVGELMPARNFYIALYDRATNLISMAYHVDEFDALPPPPRLGTGLTAYVLRTGQPLLVNPQSYAQLVENGHVEKLGAPPLGWLGVPLKTMHETIGVMTVQTYTESNLLSGADKDVLLFVSAQVAMAIERKRAEAHIHRLNRMLRLINEANQTLVRADQETELLERICQIIVEMGGYRMTWVGLAEHDVAQSVRPVACAGHGTDYLDNVDITWADTEQGRGPMGTAIRMGQLVVVRDISTDPHFAPWRASALQRGYSSSIALPLLSDGQAFGALDIYAGEPNAFDADEIRLLTEMADDLVYGLLALRIQDAHRQAEEEIKRLNRDLERRAKGLSALNSAGQLMASILDQNTLLAQVMEQARQLLDVESASVLLCVPPASAAHVPPQDLVFAGAPGTGSDKLVGIRLPGTVGIAGWVVQHREALIVHDTRRDPRFDNRVDDISGMATRSLMAVPLVSRGLVLGVIEAVNKFDGSFDSHDLDMLKTLASSAAIAIDNAQLFTEELDREAALKRALEQQRELDRLQREFIQNVSHELRTPLALIRGHAELLESDWMGELNAEQKESIGVIARRSLMLTKLVNDIVTVLEVEQRELVHEPFDMAMLVHSVLAGFRPAAEQADLVLSAEISPNLPLAHGDSIAFRRALDNLLNNALKFTPAGGRITVRLYQIERNLMIEVADTGIGIPYNQLDRIFERFYQVDGSSTRKYGGIGLGLSLVKSIVEGHHGEVIVTSTVGVGTAFTITLPLDEI